ncbi:MAG: hypothetical protein ACPGWR_22965 [Ardenticatenaceae bacterium]
MSFLFRISFRHLPLLFLLLLTVVLTWPTVITLSTHVVDRQDPLLNAWIMAWEAHQLLVAPFDLYDTNIFFPLHNTLAFSEILLSTSLLVMPLQWLSASNSALLSYNVAFLLSFFTTALGAYLLALYLTGHRGAALVAAVAFAWSPYRMGHLSQVQLLAFGWLPLALIYLDRLLRGTTTTTRSNDFSRSSGPERLKSLLRTIVRDGFLFGLFFLLQALASFYAALFSAMACGLYVVGWVLWRRRLPWSALAGGVLATVMVGLIMVPLSRPYFEVQETLGAGWTLEQNEQFSASLQAYLYAPEGTMLWGALTRPLRYVYGACCPPDTLFPGLTLLMLSGVALWRGGGGATQASRGGLWLMMGLVAFVLSLGPTLTVYALEPTGLALPYRWLWHYVPGFNAIRAPVRWAVLLTLALSMLSAIGIARLRWRGVAPLAMGLVLIEFAVVPLPLVTAPEAPASLAWLKAQPATRILELPLAGERPRPAVPNDQPRRAWELSRLLEMQYFSTEHWHTTPDGYSGYVPSRHGDLAREMQAFPSRRAVTLLQGLGVRYVIIHEDDLDSTRAALLSQPLPDKVREIARFDEERILELAPYQVAETIPSTLLPINSLPPEQQIAYPLVLTTPNAPYVPLEGEPVEIQVTWQDNQHHIRQTTIRVPWPMIIEQLAVLHLPLQTPPPGDWSFTLSGSYPGGHTFHLEQPINIADSHPLPPRLLPLQLAVIEPNDKNRLHILWRSEQPLERYYSLSVRLLDENGHLIAKQDGPPGGDVPTIAWQAGRDYGANWTFDDLPQGSTWHDYRLQLLWYDPEGGPPVRIWDGQHFVEQLEVP